MGKVVQSSRADEEEGRWAVERATERVERGDMEGALWLLQRARRVHPASRGLAELQAVAQVCLAAAWNPGCACCVSAASHHHSHSPHWYRILMVNESADLGAIKRKYRQLALLLHPDKNKHSRAEEAFKLVSEAYAHLSDSTKRETFDALIRERECRKCSSAGFQERATAANWDHTTGARSRSSRESLKGKNRASPDFRSCSFPFGFHTAEWRTEHEKLRVFRERAQAKVDSLAHILKEQRSRWSQEMQETVEERYKRVNEHRANHACNFQSRGCSQRYHYPAERRAFFPSSLEEGRYDLGKATEDRSLSDRQGMPQIWGNRGDGAHGDEERMAQNLSSRTSGDTQTPQVLQKLKGLIELLKEELTGSNSDIDHAILSGNGEAGGVAAQDATAQSHRDGGESCTSSVLRAPQYISGNKHEEELTVIDNFLAGLNDHDAELGNQPWLPAQDSTGLCFDKPKDHSLRRNAPSYYKAESNSDGSRQKGCRNGSRTSQGSTTASTQNEKIIQSCHCDLSSRRSGAERATADSSLIWNKSGSADFCDEEKVIQRQKKKSDQLMRTLERLREETQSVVATLESMKTEARIFPASCHVPTAIAT